jgi:Holliday junction DNA helicase RuvB
LPVSTNPTNLYRPVNFEEYIGQEKAKSQIKSYIAGIKSRNLIFPHTLIYGKAGCGKTTLARIIAKELGVTFGELITANVVDIEVIKWKLIQINKGILFMDEIHSLPRKFAERLYSIMEDFKDNGKDIEHFTLIGATTELGEMVANRKPFVDRFEIKIELMDYTTEELMTIIKQYKEKMFSKDNITPEVYNIIANNSRFTPRTSIRLLKDCIYSGDIKTTLINNNIIKDGYTNKDLKVLKYLAQNEKGVGINSIATFLDTSIKNYQYEIESYLVKNELIVKATRGRKITNKGLEIIKELEK